MNLKAEVSAVRQETDKEVDTGLVLRFKNGEQAVFVEMVARHRPRILSFCIRQMRGRVQDAEEITQDTFIRAYRKLAEFRVTARSRPGFTVSRPISARTGTCITIVGACI